MASSARSVSKYLESVFGLAGKVAVVTGGSSGIGREMATALAMAGASVVIVARRPESLAETVDKISAAGAQAHGFSLDVGDAEALEKAVASINKKHGVPDILVNAAGNNHRPHMDQLSRKDWEDTMAVNLNAPFFLGQAWGPRMAERGSGRIINVVSQQAFRAYGNSGAYGASKGGLVALTRSQAEAWSSRGVLCNAVAPGVVDTPLTAAVFNDQDKIKAHASRTMIGRNGIPTDFAGVALFLASNASLAVTGQTIFVDGGYSAT
jgi:gluconate 5-dehydrogenase